MIIIQEKFENVQDMLWLLNKYADELSAEFIVLYSEKDYGILFDYQELIHDGSNNVLGIKRYVCEQKRNCVEFREGDDVNNFLNYIRRDCKNIRLFSGETSVSKMV